jgi:hypothetical protein
MTPRAWLWLMVAGFLLLAFSMLIPLGLGQRIFSLGPIGFIGCLIGCYSFFSWWNAGPKKTKA